MQRSQRGDLLLLGALGMMTAPVFLRTGKPLPEIWSKNRPW